MTASVFISHSSKDRAVAQKICAALEKRGLTCWVAARDVGLGENFQEAIVRAIRAAQVMVLVFTDNANSSPEVKKELALASRHSITVIPARVENVDPSEALAYELATRQWIDLFENWDEEIERLGKTLAINTKASADSASQRLPEPSKPEISPLEKQVATPRLPPAVIHATPTEVANTGFSKPAPGEEDVGDDGTQSTATTALLVVGSAMIFGLALGNLTAVAILTLIAMTLGLALFYASNTRSLSDVLMRLIVAIGTIALLWIIFGYTLTHTGGSDFFGGFSRAFLAGLSTDSQAATFLVGKTISELSYIIFQGCVAAITAALVISILGQRIRLAAIASFLVLWATFVYFPLGHMLWYWAGPDAISDAAKALAAATDGAAKTAAQAKLDQINADAGWLFKKGALDYAGGIVIAINAGLAGLVGLYFIGGAKETSRNSNASMSGTAAMGLSLTWLAWLGLNAGASLNFADPATNIAMANCVCASGAAAMAGLMAEWAMRGQLSLRGAVYGALAGIVAATPGSGFSGTTGAAVLGLCAGTLAVVSVNVGRAYGTLNQPDMALIYCLSGILGTLATAILVDPHLGGTGVMDYVSGKISEYDFAPQMISQLWGVCTAVAWSGIGSAIIYMMVDVSIGLRPKPPPSSRSA